MRVSDILRDQERAVAIVHYKPLSVVDGNELYHGGFPPQNPACLLQVTLDAGKVSPSGKLIRFGTVKDDEIMGWTRMDALEVVELLWTSRSGDVSDETKVPVMVRHGEAVLSEGVRFDPIRRIG